ncbi:MAG: hypothetical protein JRJ12_13980 [Deltaproteobacteria bacterium]|nr:hypothetical protein [Deltaproteobacteria bacterium]
MNINIIASGKLRPGFHEFNDEFIYPGLSAELAIAIKVNLQNTSLYLRIEGLRKGILAGAALCPCWLPLEVGSVKYATGDSVLFEMQIISDERQALHLYLGYAGYYHLNHLFFLV